MLAIVIPYRDQEECDRGAQLRAQLNHLQRLGERTRTLVVVVRQSADGRKFNRGQLLNEGFVRARALGAQRVCFHDVDLLLDDVTAYFERCEDGPVHLAAGFRRYASPTYFGGVVLSRTDHVLITNGFPNFFFGWGGEDDAMLRRVRRTALVFRRQRVPLRDLENLDLQSKLQQLREGDSKYLWKREALERDAVTWRDDGVNTSIQSPAAVISEYLYRDRTLSVMVATVELVSHDC
jgi:hypothetical protein